MDVTAVAEHVERIAATRQSASCGRDDLEAALRSVTAVRSWLAASHAELTSQLSALVSFPEQAIAECTRGSTRDAVRDTDRAATLAASPGLAAALDDARVTAGHVDEVTRASKPLDETQRTELRDRIERGDLLDVAAAANVAEFRRRLALEVKRLQRSDGVDRLERQRRATRVRSWTDGDGMWCVSGRFDPLTGAKLAARLDGTVQALFAASTPDTCPNDPVEKQQHLAALALVAMVEGGGHSGRPGRAEFVVVVDTTQPDGAGGPAVDWGIPVEVPLRVLADLMQVDGVRVEHVVVRNGVVLHAPGVLDLGRTTRLANRAQRRALRAMYAGCAIPGCDVRFDRCKIHHVVWWRHGGRTDLSNLLPVCSQHHARIHDAGWEVVLGADRELTVRFPDSTVQSTGPPDRRAA